MSGKGRRGRDYGSRTRIFCTLAFLAQLPCPILGAATTMANPAPIEQTLATVRECMARSPAPWPQAWQEEYVETIRKAVATHQDASEYVVRLQILCNGFGPYWEKLRKGAERSLFEVHQAEIRWYVESLMAGELPGPDERQKLREQYQALMDYAAGALIAQFPFLDPNIVQAAKMDYLAECYRHIEAPLLPIFRDCLSEEQETQLRERWHALRYARVDLWRELDRTADRPQRNQDEPFKIDPHYLLTERSLAQLRTQIGAVGASPPDYYHSAVANEIDARRRRFQARSQAWTREKSLERTVLRVEYISSLLGALLETARDAPVALQDHPAKESSGRVTDP